jgi:hypothetical protein
MVVCQFALKFESANLRKIYACRIFPFVKIERALLTQRLSNTELTRKLPAEYKHIGVSDK